MSYYLIPSPAGAFTALCHADPGPGGELVRLAISRPSVTEAQLAELSKMDRDAFERHYGYLRQRDYLRLSQTPLADVCGGNDAESGVNMEKQLGAAIDDLLIEGRGLLVDSEGFYLVSRGYRHEAAEELSALCAAVAALEERYQALALHLSGAKWNTGFGVINADGVARLGVWPLHVGGHVMRLLLEGTFNLNRMGLVTLGFVLMSKYRDITVA